MPTSAIHIPDPELSGLAARQNELSQLHLLQAARRLYTDAEGLLVLQLAISVLLPVSAATVSLLYSDPAVKGFIAIVAILFTVVDVSVIDRRQKLTIERAAKVQEVFDCAVFELDWDEFSVGRPADPEIVLDARNRRNHKHGFKGLRNWYPVELSDLPIHLARLVCQRGALVYDSGLRRPYAVAVLILAITIFAGLMAITLVAGATWEAVALSVFAPVAPLVSWALREFQRQTDAADANDKLRVIIDALHAKAEVGTCDAEECTRQTRLIQSELYRQRKSKPPIFGWVYKLNRLRLERRMRGVAAEFVRRFPGTK